MDFGSGERPSGPRYETFLIEHINNLLIGVRRGQSLDAFHDCGLGADDIGAFLKPGDFQLGKCFGLPTDTNVDGGCLSGQSDIFDQKAEQLFALCLGGRFHLPEQREILSQRENAVTFSRTGQLGSRSGESCIFAFQLLDIEQFVIPIPFQAASD
jgi:hypothetical protein